MLPTSQRLYCVTLTNIDAVFFIDEPTDKQANAQLIACIPLLVLGEDALTPTIIERMRGEEDVVRHHLDGPRGDLAIIRNRLISLACVANNSFHPILCVSRVALSLIRSATIL